MKRPSSKVITLALCLMIAVLGISNVLIFTNSNHNLSDSSHLTGTVLVQVTDANGTVVSQTKQDQITSISYDYIACLVWGSTCGSVGGSGGNNIWPTTLTITTTQVITTYAPYNTFLSGIALSTGTQTSTSCSNVQTANGLAPLAVYPVGHAAQVNTPIVTLTGSWTFTSSSVTITSVCLVPALSNEYISAITPGVVAVGSTMVGFAYENFAGQTLTSGQSIGITWTFNM